MKIGNGGTNISVIVSSVQMLNNMFQQAGQLTKIIFFI